MTAQFTAPLDSANGEAKGRILIVEGDAKIADALKASAGSGGYQVVGVCRDPNQALEAAKQTRPNLVISGIFFSGKPDGIELSRELQQALGLPVVFVGAADDPMLMLQISMVQPAGCVSDANDERYLGAVLGRALKGVRTSVGSPF
ncbi:MAG: response regulator [Bryobacterales bacterium]|nr:response regulator [Bryobacterales bacterium]